jgi:hypothetical protein
MFAGGSAMKPKTKLLYLAAFLVVALPLALTGNAGAGYYWDGAVPSGTTDNWITPNDMVCIKGIHTDGTLDLVPGVTNSRQCIYNNTGLKTLDPVDVTGGVTAGPPLAHGDHSPTVKTLLTTYGTCKDSGSGGNSSYVWDFVNNRCLDVSKCSGTDATTKGTLTWNAGSSTCSDSAACVVIGFTKSGYTSNDGAKHALATSICVDPVTGDGIPLTDLDRTFAMCAAKGGTWKQTSDSLIVSGSGASATATVQVAATPNFGGSCVAYTRQFAGEDANGTPLTFGSKGTTSAQGGFCYTTLNMTSAYPNSTVCPVSDNLSHPNAGFNSSTAYDWSFTTPAKNDGTDKCTYAKGTAGFVNAALTKVDGTTYAAAGSFKDLSTLATMGDCIANGGSWNNWVGSLIVAGGFGKPLLGTTSVPTTSASSAVTASFDAATKTITKTAGTSFVTTGYTIGDTIKTSNASNPGPFTINAVTATVITVNETVVTVTPAVGVFLTDLSKPKASSIPNWDFTRQAPDPDNGCLHCHSTKTQYNGPAERQKDSYLKTGHKNIFRKVTPDKDWAGPDMDGVLQFYTDAATGPISFSAPPTAWIDSLGGLPQSLLYIFGDWMTPAPDGLNVIVDVGGYAKANGTSSELCASCHTTGWNNPTAGVCSLSSKTTEGDCTGAGGTWYPSIGVEGIGHPLGFTPAEPQVSFPTTDFTGAGRWVRDGIQCSRCHNAVVGKVVDSQILASDSKYKSTHVTNGGMGSLAAGTGRTNLCFGCHQSIAKEANGTGANADTSHPEKLQVTNTATAPNYVPDFYGRGPGNMFLNSPHARYTGKIVPNSLGKYDLEDTSCTFSLTTPCSPNDDGNASKYNSKFQGYTCWQSPTSTSPAKTWIDNTEINPDKKIKEIKTQAKCEELYGPGTWRTDNQGTCVTCHDVHNSLFVEEQREAALRKVCTDCHNKSLAKGAINHPDSTGTPLDVPEAAEACVTCHMPRASASGIRMHLFRINPEASYRTFPTAAEYDVSDSAPTKRIANAAADGTYTNAVWVDVDYVCGQCHGGSFGRSATRNGAPWKTRAELSNAAANMHNNPVPKGYTLTVNITPPALSDATFTLLDKKGKSIIQTGTGTSSYVFSGVTAGTYRVKVQHTDCTFDGDGKKRGEQNPISVVVGSGSKTVTFIRTPHSP